MNATRLWYAADTGQAIESGPVACWLCGLPCRAEDCRPAADVVRDTFSDHDRARASSGLCCPACAAYLDYKILRPGQKRGMGLYTKSVLVLGSEWSEWARERMAADLLAWHQHGLPVVAVLACNYSKQKHVLPWARVNPAGTRRPWVQTDKGAVRLTDALPVLVGAVATLWASGHGKTALANAQLTPFVLARSPDPVHDLNLAAVLAPHAGGPELELASYVVTEENRDGYARELAPLLPGAHAAPAAGGNAGGDRERGGRPGIQRPLCPPVVGDAGGAREALRDDERRPGPLEQLALL